MTRRDRILIIGLDSADLALLGPWMDAGELPHLNRLVCQGAAGPLRSTIPPISPVAWASFATGKNPGQHGIFDFREPGARASRSFVSTASRKGRSLWQILSAAGRNVGVINVPFSYPPESVRGFFVSGYGAPNTKSAYTHPPELREEIEQACPGYRIHLHALKYDYWRRFDRYVQELHKLVESRTCLARHLLTTRTWDVAMVTYFATDTVQHIGYHLTDPSHPDYDPGKAARHGNPILEIYRRVDAAVGELVETAQKLGDPLLVLVVSDHGGAPIYGYISLNSWLEDRGLIHYRKRSLMALWGRLLALVGLAHHRGAMVRGKRVWALLEERFPLVRRAMNRLPGPLFADGPARTPDEVDWPHTLAYAQGDYGQIRLHTDTDREELLLRIQEEIQSLVDPSTGERVVEDCLRLRETYAGPYRDQAADLLVVAREGYLLESNHDRRSRIVGREPAPTRKYSGMHGPYGLLIAWGEGIEPGPIQSACLIDIAPTVLHVAGCPVPADMDGRVLEEVFTPSFRAAHPVQVAAAEPETETARHPVYSGREARDLEDRLRGLGYLE
jgi:predicted AlkP superfamily phosphohydrolase/phosphomutase